MRSAQTPGSWWRDVPNGPEAAAFLQPGKEALDKPSTLVASQVAAILGREFQCGSGRGYHVDAVLLKVVIEPIAVISAITNKMLRLGLQHVEAELSCTNVTS